MADCFESKFVGDKISKVRYLDEGGNSEFLLSGSYDSRNNNVCLWSIKVTANEDNELESVIENTCRLDHKGDVMGLDSKGGIVASSSSYGDVNIYKTDKLSFNPRIELVYSWQSLHSFNSGNDCPCTDVSIEDNIATCGEDGSIHILDPTKPAPIRSLVSCDSAALTSVLWVTQQCVAVVNTCGQLKVYDIRQSGSQPIQKFVLSRDFNPLNCLEKHPSQHHLVATGSYNGMLGIYDLRQDNVPVTILEGHNGSSITDIKFHPRSPDSLFSCASDGSVWQWNGARSNRIGGGGDVDSGPSSWFLADAAKHRVEVVELTSTYTQAATSMQGYEVNSLDISNNTLICGTDNGALCIFYDVNV